MSATDAEIKLCDEKHKNVDRRLIALEEDKKARDAAGWKSFVALIIALASAFLSAYSTIISKGVAP